MKFKIVSMILLLLLSMAGVFVLYQHAKPNKSSALSADDHMIQFLKKYIRINTSQPKPDYQRALNFLRAKAIKDGFQFQEVVLPSGRSALIITLAGADPSLKSVVLNHHMDVVPVPNAIDWKALPFAGRVVDGHIIGRGAQDMKGIAAVHYSALKGLKNLGIPRRTVHIFAVPDEEIGGFTGTKQLLESPLFSSLNVGFLLDEGHASGNPNMLEIKISERKPLQIKLTSVGALSHGSHLLCNNAIHHLIKALHALTAIHNQEQHKAVNKPAGLCLSLNITSLQAGVQTAAGKNALNVVPDYAQSTVDIRVPPTMRTAEVQKQLEEVFKPFNISYQVLAQAKEEPLLSEHFSELYNRLACIIEKHGFAVQPHYFEGASDLRFYLDRGIDGVGITPFTIEDNIHGTNESVSIEDLIRARKILVDFLIDFCT